MSSKMYKITFLTVFLLLLKTVTFLTFGNALCFFFFYEKSNFAMKMRCDFVSVFSFQIFILQNITFRQCKLLPFLLAFWLAYHKFFFKNIYVIFFSKEKWREKRVFKNGNLVSIWGNYLADFAL